MSDNDYTPEQLAMDTEQLNAYWEGTHDEAVQEVGALGFHRVLPPRFTCPVLDPKELTNMNLTQYAETHIRYVAWWHYAENNLAYCRSMLLGVKRQLGQLEARLKIYYASYKNPTTGKPFSIDDRKLMVETNPRFVELYRDQTKLEAEKELLESHTDGLSKGAALISRHVELRRLDMESGRASGNMPGRGLYPQG